MNEAETRAELIDKQLAAAGWETNAQTTVKIRREYNITAGEILASGIRQKQLQADYVLEYKNTQLAVVEAKSIKRDVSEGVEQAKIYAKKLQLKICFAANGKTIYQINLNNGVEGEVAAFPTPQDLWQLHQQLHRQDDESDESNQWLNKLCQIPFEDYNGTRPLRYYQQLATNHAITAIANNKDRILLTLATGTGKTFIAFQIAHKLFKSRWTLQGDGAHQPRILFLADRNILANQAFLDFRAFGEDAMVRITPEIIAQQGGVPKNGSVFFTIFQTLMSGNNLGEPYYKQYPHDFFDLIIIDECHRGGAHNESTWRDILNYFSHAVHLGLTATPKRKDNTNTYQYFGNPVFIYKLKDGIGDGFLTPYKVKRIKSDIDEYTFASDDEVMEGEVEKGKLYTESDFNVNIEIKEREHKRVKDMLSAINQHEKTIVFCRSQNHAAIVRDLINQTAQKPGGDYCVRITANDGALGDTYLRQFQDNEKTRPTIVTTSHKLTTGVDARNVRHIVLMRPIKDIIQFKQIIGRGTRLFEGKNYFTIIDFVGAFHLFNDPEWDGEPLEKVEETITLTDDEDNNDSTDWNERDNDNEEDGDERPRQIKIKLSDNRVRQLQSITTTYFYADGKTISAEQFLKRLFDVIKLPQLIESEERLQKIWSKPSTRKQLLQQIEEAGCHKEDLKKLQELIEPRDSDLFDVLEYIAYAKPPISRIARVESNKDKIFNALNRDQQEFIEYVLNNYIEVGTEELDDSKLSALLTARYGSLSAAVAKLGEVEDIRRVFIDFQQHLYTEAA